MKKLQTLIALFLLTLPTFAAQEMQPLDKDIPLSEGIRRANELFPDVQPLTEGEIVAAVKNIKLKHSDIKPDVYGTYMRVVNERVLPKGMYFSRITALSNSNGRFQVDWKDLCLVGRLPTEAERKEIVSRLSPGINLADPSKLRVGGFGYRIRERFVSSGDNSQDK